MVPCINQVTTLDTSFDDDLTAYAQAGWKAIEIWLTKLETALRTQSVADVKKKLEDAELMPLGASSQGGLLSSRGAAFDEHRDQFLRRLELARELGVGTMILTPDFVTTPDDAELGHAIATLARAAQTAESHGIRLALEFQKSSKFCASLDTTLALIAQCGAANVGVCLDLFHYYTGPSKFEDLAYLTAENLAWVQVCDLAGTPREVAGDSDRILPGEGDFQIAPILDHLQQIGYTGAISLEVLNPTLWSIPVDRVADAAARSMANLLGDRKARGGA
jgi:sugar phosphate isomerase/epimerase